MRQYILKVKCNNCGFGGLFGRPVAFEYQQPVSNQVCPVCGLRGFLYFHNGYLAETKMLDDGLTAENQLVVRNKGKFVSTKKKKNKSKSRKKTING